MSRFLGIIGFVLLAATAAAANDESLIGWHDFHLKISDAAQAGLVNDFANQHKLLIARENYLTYPEDVLVSPAKIEEFKEFLRQNSVEFEIADTDIGSKIIEERSGNVRQSRSVASDPSTYFAQSSQINSWLAELASQNPGFASVEDIGKSYENRNLVVLKLSTNPSANKPIIFVDAAIHAREWLAPASLNYIIKDFVANRNSAQLKPLFDKYDWYFQPVVNPDGYDYTFRSSTTRFWRKTRQPYGRYYGADPNRNFDFQFGGAGTSNNPASDIYHGPRAFSEPETLALSRFLTGIQSRLQRGMYVSFHTYGQLWLTPPGYTRQIPSDHQEMLRVANAGNDALRAVNGISFTVGQPANVGLYEAAGGSYDWVKFKLGVKYSYTLELRPKWPAGINGFLANVRDIPVSGGEISAALKASAAALP